LLIIICWIIAMVATLGSLFFSEVMAYAPCVLCWYQRIAMYPLVIIFLIGSFQSPRVTFSFSAPFVLGGWLISIYHNLLHFGVIPESASPCISGVPCSTVYINWFGFLTIPILSLIAFSALGVLLVIINRKYTYEK
jgi:disulfide bond formation protein DsbB